MESIKKRGILNPLLSIVKENQLHLVAGQQRLEAAKALGLSTVPVRTVKGDAELLAFNENLLRDEPTVIETAEMLQKLKVGKRYRIEQIVQVSRYRGSKNL